MLYAIFSLPSYATILIVYLGLFFYLHRLLISILFIYQLYLLCFSVISVWRHFFFLCFLHIGPGFLILMFIVLQLFISDNIEGLLKYAKFMYLFSSFWPFGNIGVILNYWVIFFKSIFNLLSFSFLIRQIVLALRFDVSGIPIKLIISRLVMKRMVFLEGHRSSLRAATVLYGCYWTVS